MMGAAVFACPAGRMVRANSSTSPITSAPASRARRTTAWGLGWVKGTPGLKMRASILAHGQRSQGSGMAPSPAARRRVDSLSSQAKTEAPPALSERIAESPERASPKTPTALPLKPVTSIILASAQFQGREPDQRQNHREDPKPDHDGRLAPAKLLEMVMDRRHAKHTPARGLERDHLHHDGHRFHHEQSADDPQHDLMLDGDGRRAQDTAKRQRTGVAHEDHGRRRVEPQEAEPCTDQRSQENRQFAGTRDVIDLQIIGEADISDEI